MIAQVVCLGRGFKKFIKRDEIVFGWLLRRPICGAKLSAKCIRLGGVVALFR